MRSNDIGVVTKGNLMLIETVQILLIAESGRQDSTIFYSLTFLLEVIDFYDNLELLNSSYASAMAVQFNFISFLNYSKLVLLYMV